MIVDEGGAVGFAAEGFVLRSLMIFEALSASSLLEALLLSTAADILLSNAPCFLRPLRTGSTFLERAPLLDNVGTGFLTVSGFGAGAGCVGLKVLTGPPFVVSAKRLPRGFNLDFSGEMSTPCLAAAPLALALLVAPAGGFASPAFSGLI